MVSFNFFNCLITFRNLPKLAFGKVIYKIRVPPISEYEDTLPRLVFVYPDRERPLILEIVRID